jgi:hypothetical protein
MDKRYFQNCRSAKKIADELNRTWCPALSA